MKVIEQLKHLSEERFAQIYGALAQHGFGPLDAEVAKVMKFRPLAIRKLPIDQRARRARRILEQTGNAELCYELMGTYLFTTQKDLVLEFLDLTGVEHEDGIIKDVESALPAHDKVTAAVLALDQKYPADDVTLYLAIAAEQWPGVPEVDAAWRARLG